MGYSWGGPSGGVDEAGQPFTFLPRLPFLPEFHEKVRDGRKTMTCRSKTYGQAGDRLQGPDCVLVLEYVAHWPLGTIAHDFYGLEGLDTPADFIEVWNRIHPKKRYDPATLVWVHRFRVEGTPPVSDMGKILERASKKEGGGKA